MCRFCMSLSDRELCISYGSHTYRSSRQSYLGSERPKLLIQDVEILEAHMFFVGCLFGSRTSERFGSVGNSWHGKGGGGMVFQKLHTH